MKIENLSNVILLKIEIVSGEGEIGTVEKYRGKKTNRALKMRLTRERCCGDRWAYANIYFTDGTECKLDF